MNIEVYVATQKPVPVSLEDCYRPIFVGSAARPEAAASGYLQDNDGDNISAKNPNYCELTALYWAWKNSTADVVGLMHYRRYLAKKEAGTLRVLTRRDIEIALQDREILLPEKVCLLATVRVQYAATQYEKDFDLLRAVIAGRCPEYLPDFDAVAAADSIYSCNIFIARKELTDAYCTWLFGILSALEEQVDMTGYSKYEQRIYGYLSERMFNIWLLHNHPKVREFSLYHTEEPLLDRLRYNVALFAYKVLKIDVIRYMKKLRH